VIDPHAELSATAAAWDQVPNQAFEARCMEVYAAMLDRMDQGIGQIVENLRRHGQLENTLILFLQDNWGCAELNGRTGPFVARGTAPSFPPLPKDAIATYSGSMPQKQTRDGWPVRQGYGVMPGPADTFVAYGPGWANVSDTPFREYKHWVHEGGISTPLIAHWPAGIPTPRAGRIESQPGHLIDLMATCPGSRRRDLSGYGARSGGSAARGSQFAARVLRGSTARVPSRISWEHEGNRAVRAGNWKLASSIPTGWELYDMAKDRSELHDLSAAQPNVVKALAGQWDQWAARVGVLPWEEVQRAEKAGAVAR
jgi:arylsulfatase